MCPPLSARRDPCYRCSMSFLDMFGKDAISPPKPPAKAPTSAPPARSAGGSNTVRPATRTAVASGNLNEANLDALAYNQRLSKISLNVGAGFLAICFLSLLSNSRPVILTLWGCLFVAILPLCIVQLVALFRMCTLMKTRALFVFLLLGGVFQPLWTIAFIVIHAKATHRLCAAGYRVGFFFGAKPQ